MYAAQRRFIRLFIDPRLIVVFGCSALGGSNCKSNGARYQLEGAVVPASEKSEEVVTTSESSRLSE